MSESYSRKIPEHVRVDMRKKFLNTDPTVYQNTTVDKFRHYGPFNSTFSGSKLPNYRDIIRAGGDATTPATGVRYVTKKRSPIMGGLLLKRFQPNPPWSFNSVIQEDIFGFPSVDGVFTSEPSPSQSIKDSVRNRCVANFVSQAKSITSTWRSGTDLGEWRETVNTVTRPLSSLRRHTLSYFDKLKKVRQRKRRIDVVRGLNDTYLEWTFGWNPLRRSIQDALQLLHKRFEGPMSKPIRAHAQSPFAGSVSSWNPVSDNQTTSLLVRGSLSITAKHTYRAIGAVKLARVGASRPVYEDMGLIPSEFLPTVWNLLPYSFVIDYFVNVGDIIDALSFRYSDLQWGCFTERTETTWLYKYLSYTLNYDPAVFKVARVGVSLGDNEYRLVRFSRSRITPGSLLPTLAVKLPVSAKPWVNIGSLITSKMLTLTPLTK